MQNKSLKFCVVIIAMLILSTSAWAGTATLSWSSSTESVIVGYKIYYGTASSTYTQVADVGLTRTPDAPEYIASNLAEGNTYYFVLTAYDVFGNESGFSNEVSKIIPASSASDTMAPIVSDLSTRKLTRMGVTISWTTNEPAESQIEFGFTANYGSFSTLMSTLETRHTHILTGLIPQSLYHYRVRNRDATGNLGVSGDMTFMALTSSDSVLPLISAVQHTDVSPSHVTIRWVTDEPSTSQVEYGASSDYGFSTALGAELTFDHSWTITQLKPDFLYHYRVKSADGSGNLAYSTDQTFTTASLQDTSSLPGHQKFQAMPGDEKITLSWSYPNLPNLKGVQIIYRSDGQYPANLRDGTFVGDFTSQPGQQQTFTHMNLTNGTTYNYAALSYDDLGNFSEAIYAKATPHTPTPENGDTVTGSGCGRIKDVSGNSGPRDSQIPLNLLIYALLFFLIKMHSRLPCRRVF